MAGKSSLFIRQSVIGLGFLSGIFTAIGIDPQEVLIRIAGEAAGSVWPDPLLRAFFLILPAVLLILSVLTAYRKGRMLGLISVMVAYFAGISLFVSVPTALLLLAGAAVLGFVATDRRLKKHARLF